MNKGAFMDTIQSNKGYTFIELVVSVLIFAVGFLGVTKMEQIAITGNSFGMQMTNTLNIADSQMEYLRGLNLDHTDLIIGDHDGGTKIHQGVSYDVAWTVSTTGLGPSTNARQVDVAITWTEKTTPHSVTMSMFRSTSQ